MPGSRPCPGLGGRVLPLYWQWQTGKSSVSTLAHVGARAVSPRTPVRAATEVSEPGVRRRVVADAAGRRAGARRDEVNVRADHARDAGEVLPPAAVF